MNQRNYLNHYGVLGMRWGKHKISPVSTKTEKPKKGKLYINSSKKIDGKDLTDDIFNNIGTVMLSSFAGRLLAESGHETAAMVMQGIGLFAVGSAIGNVAVRVERKKK